MWNGPRHMIWPGLLPALTSRKARASSVVMVSKSKDSHVALHRVSTQYSSVDR
jgi:hypothetical protein